MATTTQRVFDTKNGAILATRMHILNNGNVGIGTIVPNQKLEVLGTIRASNLLGGATSLSTDVNGDIIRTPSDARLKMDIKPIENALLKVISLKGYTYSFIDGKRFGTTKQIGFLVQDLEKIVPEAVSDDLPRR